MCIRDRRSISPTPRACPPPRRTPSSRDRDRRIVDESRDRRNRSVVNHPSSSRASRTHRATTRDAREIHAIAAGPGPGRVRRRRVRVRDARRRDARDARETTRRRTVVLPRRSTSTVGTTPSRARTNGDRRSRSVGRRPNDFPNVRMCLSDCDITNGGDGTLLTLRTDVRLHVLALRKVSLHVAQGFGVEHSGGGETGRARGDARLGGARRRDDHVVSKG